MGKFQTLSDPMTMSHAGVTGEQLSQVARLVRRRSTDPEDMQMLWRMLGLPPELLGPANSPTAQQDSTTASELQSSAVHTDSPQDTPSPEPGAHTAISVMVHVYGVTPGLRLQHDSRDLAGALAWSLKRLRSFEAASAATIEYWLDPGSGNQPELHVKGHPGLVIDEITQWWREEDGHAYGRTA